MAWLVAASACGPNPAFDLHGGASAAGASTSGGSTTAGVSTATPAPTTGEPATSGVGATTGTAPSGTTTSGSSSEPGETAATTDAPASTGPDATTGGMAVGCPDDPALVGCYLFPPGETATLVDGSPNGPNGTMSEVSLAPSFDAAQYGDVLRLNGTTSDATIPHDSVFTEPRGTVALFARAPLLMARKTLVDKGEQYGLFVEDGLLSCIVVYKDSNEQMQTVKVEMPAPTDQWIHVGCVYNGAEIRLVVHAGDPGTALATEAVGSLWPSGMEIGVGHNEPDGGEDLEGFLDNILFYTRDLTDAELCALAGPLCVP